MVKKVILIKENHRDVRGMELIQDILRQIPTDNPVHFLIERDADRLDIARREIETRGLSADVVADMDNWEAFKATGGELYNQIYRGLNPRELVGFAQNRNILLNILARGETPVVPIDVTDEEIRRVLEALPIGRLIARASSLTGVRGSRDLVWPPAAPDGVDTEVWARVSGISPTDLFICNPAKEWKKAESLARASTREAVSAALDRFPVPSLMENAVKIRDAFMTSRIIQAVRSETEEESTFVILIGGIHFQDERALFDIMVKELEEPLLTVSHAVPGASIMDTLPRTAEDILREVGIIPLVPAAVLTDVEVEAPTPLPEAASGSVEAHPAAAGGSSGTLVGYFTVSYVNPILNHPTLLLQAKAIGGMKLVNSLIEVGRDRDVALALLKDIEENGLDATLRLLNGEGSRDQGAKVESSSEPVLYLDSLKTNFNVFLSLVESCKGNIEFYAQDLINKAEKLLNQILDSGKETSRETVMTLLLIDVIESLNSAGSIPLPGRRDPNGPDEYYPSSGGGDHNYTKGFDGIIISTSGENITESLGE